MKFDDFLEKEIYSKINLKDIMFNPLSKGISKNNIAATELNGNTRAGNRLFRNARKDIVHGQVHDGKSYYCMSGVSAHAGLFSTSKNIAKLSYDLIVSENELISRETLNEFISRIDLKFSQTKGGWRRQDHVNKDSYVWFSEFASDKTIGHTGWTGTNTHIDLENNLVISLNTNRRNCPIDSKTGEFISSDLHISNYHIVSELVYRALGLADNIGIEIYMYEKIKKLTENYCIDLSKKSLSYRNSIRVFLELLNTLSTKYSSLNKLNLSDEIVKLKNDLLLYEFEDFSYFRMEEK